MKIELHQLILIIAFLGFTSQVISQEKEPQNVREAYDQMITESSSWEIYKVIPKDDVEKFRGTLEKVIDQKNQMISIQEDLAEANAAEAMQFKIRTDSLKSALTRSESMNDSIDFLGITFSKSVYNTIVWVKMFVLFGLLLFCYYMFLRSNKVTKSATREVESLKAELDDQRTKTREVEQKLKRELQTARNILNEKGIDI